MGGTLTFFVQVTNFLFIISVNGDISSNLVSYWSFSGDASDDSQHGNDGTVNGAILTYDRFNQSNEAYFFDGIDDYISILNSSNNNINYNLEIYSSDVSVSAWFKTSTTSNSRIYSKGSSSCLTGYMVRTNNVNGNQHVLWEMSSNNYCILQLTGATMINDNKWLCIFIC